MFFGGLNGDDFFPSGEDDYYYPSSYSRKVSRSRSNFQYNPLYYYVRLPKLTSILRTTEKAVLLNVYGVDVWFPSKIVKYNDKYIYIHRTIGLEILEKCVPRLRG